MRNSVDERKSWKRLIFAYAGAALLVLVAGFFVVRGASNSSMIVAHAGSTPTPTVVGVYSGIAPDATQPPAAATHAPSASAAPSQSPTPAPHPSPGASSKAALKVVAQTTKDARKHQGAKHHSKVQLVADVAGAQGHIVPIVHANGEPPVIEKPASAVSVDTPTDTPATAAPVVATEAPVEAAPAFAPNRIVDAQVRVAVQPEYSEMDRERGARGTSVVLVTIDPKGRVVNTTVGSSSGYPSLDRAAMAAARASEFVAPKINGRPATETYRVVYDFAP